MDREQQFTRLTGMLAKYEVGDVMLLSDIIDALAGLDDFYLECPVGTDFIVVLQAWMNRNLKSGANPDFADQLGQALALLQKWKSTLNASAKERIEQEMLSFRPKLLEGTNGVNAAGAVNPRNDQLGTNRQERLSLGETKQTVIQTENSIAGFQSTKAFTIFITEAKERLAQAQELVLALEARPNDTESLAALFRVFHTIKGESGFLHLVHLCELTHRLENVLDLLRNQKLEMTCQLVDLLLAGIDRSQQIIRSLESGNRDMTIDRELAEFLDAINLLSANAQPALGSVLFKADRLREEDVEATLAKQRSDDFNQEFGEIVVTEKPISDADLTKALINQSQAGDTSVNNQPKSGGPENVQDEIIKVRLGKVNFLVDMIGELTIALGQVAENSGAMSQVRKITRSLQFGAMELRTDTMQGLFSNARRIIRDLSHSLNKPVEIKTEGERLEIDRNLIKSLEEPLMHLVRNALDHGLEPGEVRRAAGKSEVGTVSISATHRGSTIIIRVADDGSGLQRDKILSRAVQKGLVSQGAAATLTDVQIHDFIFQAGFSTSDTVSQVSGRGVGLDIVRSMVTASRGTIKLQTEPGKGTAFIMTFPISTAIIDGLIIRVCSNSLVVPVSSVVESLKVPQTSLMRVNGNAEVVTIRDKVIPVLRLDGVLGMAAKVSLDNLHGIIDTVKDTKKVDADNRRENDFLIGLIVENSDHLAFFLVIDEVIAKKEVVVKPLGPKFRNMRGITSGTVMAGGAVGLVLDIDQVVNLAMHREKTIQG